MRNKEKIRKKRKGAVEIVPELLYPPRCPVCDEVLNRFQGRRRLEEAGDASGRQSFLFQAENRCCAECRDSLPWVTEPVCMKCGKPVCDEGQEYCEDCRTRQHFFERGAAAFTYTGALRHCVYRMKSANRRDYVPFFAEAMAGALAPHLPRWRPEVIIPVPMHPWKRRRRGYNQSELLARELGKLTGLPVETGLLRCTRVVTSQKELGRRERMRNLQGSFAVCEPFPELSRVLLADDVYTTGSTMDEISRVLRARGVDRVYFVVLCTGKGKKAVCTAEKV